MGWQIPQNHKELTMMTLRDLERLHPSRLLGRDEYPSEGPARPEDKSIYLTHSVVYDEVLFQHGDKRVDLELWIVVGTQALVFAGPRDWLPEGTPWFCRHDEDLIDVVMVKMDENWDWVSDPGTSLAEMCARISRISTVPSATALSPITVQHPIELDGGLDLA
jgi:hypothetical protein